MGVPATPLEIEACQKRSTLMMCAATSCTRQPSQRLGATHCASLRPLNTSTSRERWRMRACPTGGAPSNLTSGRSYTGEICTSDVLGHLAAVVEPTHAVSPAPDIIRVHRTLMARLSRAKRGVRRESVPEAPRTRRLVCPRPRRQRDRGEAWGGARRRGSRAWRAVEVDVPDRAPFAVDQHRALERAHCRREPPVLVGPEATPVAVGQQKVVVLGQVANRSGDVSVGTRPVGQVEQLSSRR